MEARTIIAKARQIMRGQRVAWQNDCLFDVARLVQELTGRDMLAVVRPVLGNKAEVTDLIKRAGGIIEAIDFALTGAGMKPVVQPGVGDVGLVSSGPILPAFSVCIGSRAWLSRGENGPAIIRAEPLGAWAWV